MGKVVRINPDGIGAEGQSVRRSRRRASRDLRARIRDDGGIAIHPKTGKLWVSEHGPARRATRSTRLKKGRNYGFPVIGYGRDYTGKPINNDKTAQAGMEQPVYFWTPDIAPAGIAFYTGRMFPAWDGDLFVAALAAKYLVRLVLNGERVVGEEHLLADLNTRIRGVTEGPDGRCM